MTEENIEPGDPLQYHIPESRHSPLITEICFPFKRRTSLLTAVIISLI